jgi:hypothetical protein
LDRIEMSMFEQVHPWIIALIFGVAMWTAWTAGRGWGKRRPRQEGDEVGAKFADASLALLGLLLAFTFSMAINRHDDRRQAGVAHANAVGDFYTAASVLSEPYRSRLQNLIHDYAEFKLSRARHLFVAGEREAAIQRSLDYFSQATAIVQDVVTSRSIAAVPLINTLNNLTSTNTLHRATYRERLPWIIGLLLLVGSVIPAFLLGQQLGAMAKAPRSGIFCFFILVTFVIYVIMDLNQPKSGIIIVNQEPLERVIQGMGK